jgi:hypothetical protein
MRFIHFIHLSRKRSIEHYTTINERRWYLLRQLILVEQTIEKNQRKAESNLKSKEIANNIIIKAMQPNLILAHVFSSNTETPTTRQSMVVKNGRPRIKNAVRMSILSVRPRPSIFTPRRGFIHERDLTCLRKQGLRLHERTHGSAWLAASTRKRALSVRTRECVRTDTGPFRASASPVRADAKKN